MNEQITYLTDAVLITAVVQTGKADVMLKAAREVGAHGGIVHQARGTGARERLGLLGIAVETEKEVLSIVVAVEHQELVAHAIYNAGGLAAPGAGYLSIEPIDKLAVYIPKEARERLDNSSGKAD